MRCLLFALAGVVLTIPARGEAPGEAFPLRSPDDSLPPGYHVEERVRRGPIIAGGVLGGVAYTMGLAFMEAESGAWLVVPVAGPWLMLGYRDDACGTLGECVGHRFAGTALVLDGLVQATGAILVVIGITSPRPWAVPDSEVSISVTPYMGPAREPGLLAVGRF